MCEKKPLSIKHILKLPSDHDYFLKKNPTNYLRGLSLQMFFQMYLLLQDLQSYIYF
jgi:hypothetical protein